MPVTHLNKHVMLGPGRSLSTFIAVSGAERLNEKDILTPEQFSQFTASGQVPEYAVTWGFIPFKHAMDQWAAKHGVKVSHGELGWFPHYDTFHLDPEGFCWSSSIPRTPFVNDPSKTYEYAKAMRTALRSDKHRPLPSMYRPPYAIWTCQLTSDKVNEYGVNTRDWSPYIAHFRSLLPEHIQLVVRPHPKSHQRASQETNPYRRMVRVLENLPNTVLCRSGKFEDVVAEAEMVAGMNSTALYEAKLLYGKPAYAYAPSWYSGHSRLIPVLSSQTTTLPEAAASDDYADWFLEQFLDRQITRYNRRGRGPEIRRWLERWSAVPGNVVPRVAHFIWIGDRPLPDLYQRNLDDFRALNPDVQTVLHRDFPDDMPNDLRLLYGQSTHPQQKADILRAWLLATVGGIYFDLDFAWARTLPDSLFKSGAWCGSNHRTPTENGEMGCPPQSEAMRRYLDAIRQFNGPLHKACYGPSLLRRTIESGATFKVLPWWWFNPCRCDPDAYRPLINASVRERAITLGEFYKDGQQPVAQHLHGSVNDQYQHPEREQVPC